MDTHFWVSWVNEDSGLTRFERSIIEQHEESVLALSVFSCWEVAKKVAQGKWRLHADIDQWMESALTYPGLQLIGLEPRIILEANRLPDFPNRDPADELIVATARILDVPLLTRDRKLLDYKHVRHAQY
jgi:PIN domain nuclease of toxin-antitoxin system